MLFIVVGLPGNFTEWCSALTAALVGKPGRRADLVEADTLQELAASAIKTAGKPASVFVLHCPAGRLCGALGHGKRGFVVALDDLRSVLLELVLCRGIELAHAVRLLASSCASVISCSHLPGALVLNADRCRAQPTTIAKAIADHLGIACEAGAIAAFVEELAIDHRSFDDDDATAWWNGLEPAQRQMTMGALAPYLEPDPIGGTLPITWTGDLFAACDRPEQAASAPIDITGRARRLIDGPNIMLPLGEWSLTLTLSCSREAAEYEFQVEVAAGVQLAAAALQPQFEGDAAVRIDFDIDELTDHPVAIRVSTVRAAFDGVISVVAASLVRAAPA